MHQRAELAPTKADKRREFSCFYKGWRDFMEGSDFAPPPFWNWHERGRYLDGWNAAKGQRLPLSEACR